MTDTTTDSTTPSFLGSLKARREAILAEQTVDLQVPRWSDPEIWVRYQPVDHEAVRKSLTAVSKAKTNRAEVEVNANADILIAGCVAVFAKIDGKEYSLHPDGPDAPMTRFDEALATAIGCPPSARRVVRQIFLTDGDLAQHVNQLMKWSGFAATEAEDDLLGE